MLVALNGSMTAISNLTHIMFQVIEVIKKAPENALLFTPDYHSNFLECINNIHDIATQLNLDATLQSINHCLVIFQRGIIDENKNLILPMIEAERLEKSLDNTRQNFLTQMNSKLVFVVDTRYAEHLYSDEPPFGSIVNDAFPKASAEISEAAKCLALQRPTATVFHLMRAMELAVQKIADNLGIVLVERVWGNLLSDIDKEIKKMPRNELRNNWSAIHTHLYHVKQAWRNDTMHPKTTYTEQEAEAVFIAVKSFMVELTKMKKD